MRDAKIFQIFEGTNEVQRIVVCKQRDREMNNAIRALYLAGLRTCCADRTYLKIGGLNSCEKVQEEIIMEILVCVKQVPDDSVEIASGSEATGAPALDGVTPVVNAFDTYAQEMAVRLERGSS